MAKRADLDPEIRQLWMQRPEGARKEMDVLTFYTELQKQNPRLLSFRSHGDKYQTLKTILYGLIEY